MSGSDGTVFLHHVLALNYGESSTEYGGVAKDEDPQGVLTIRRTTGAKVAATSHEPQAARSSGNTAC